MSLLCASNFHNWKKVYTDSNLCNVQERCTRCGQMRGQIEVVHEWEWITQNPCIKKQVCRRCGEIGKIDEKEHQWREIYKPNSYDIQEICEVCGITKTYKSEFSKFIGQEEIKFKLNTLVAAARKKNESLQHLLLCAPSGMGKIKLSKIIAIAMGVKLKITSSNLIVQPGDIAGLLTTIEERSIIVIEQIEKIRKQTIEYLITSMSDFKMDIIIDSGPNARSVQIKLPQFTILGTTSKPSLIDERLRNLMLLLSFSPYNASEICQLISLSAEKQKIDITPEATHILAENSNGSPSNSVLLLRKVYNYSVAYTDGYITANIASEALNLFGSENNVPIIERKTISDEVKMFVWRRDNGCCVKCGSQENLEYDHIIPVSKGGSNTARNIQILCERCNRLKGANIF